MTNVLVMMMDDLAFGDLACHGNPYVRTPVLDALYAESVRFTKYSSGPMCTPARASLMTGRYHLRTRAIDTFCGRSMIDPGEVTLGHVLGNAGYRTGAFGKWHLGDAYPMRACDLGFDETLMHNAGGIGQPGDHRENHWREGESYYDAVLHRGGKPERTEGYCTDVFADETIAFINASVAAGEPFFAYFATNAPHTPLEVPEQWIEPYRGARPAGAGGELPLGETHARLYGMVTNIDWNIGRILSALNAAGVADNTIVVYTSDHGPCPSARDDSLPYDKQQRWNAGLRGEKGALYDGAVKVPFFYKDPTRPVPGADNDAIASPIDLLPTIAAAVGAPLPDVQLDGVDLFGGPVDRNIYMQWHRGNTPERYRNYAVITPQFKLHRPSPEKADELYDLNADPLETTDLAADNPSLVDELRAAYDAWFDDIEATRPDPFAAPRIVIGAAGEGHVVLTRQDWRISDDGSADMGELAGWMGTTPGWWEVDVVAPTSAIVEVRLDAFAWSRPDIHGTVNLRVGDAEYAQPWVLQVTCYTFAVDIPSGETIIEAFADGGPTGRRSALYVDLISKDS